ncbi:MAG: MotA/TolQ/ExbB proton channel family protein, partial [Gammaproteobacteria bacterium]|nr:MotA/TolQ/ExbB proton channel family protein [Gammaproteobacteria bacterium]
MLYELEELLEIVNNFMDTGGDVLYIIAFVLVVMWTFIIERIWFQNFTFPRDSRQMVARWTVRTDVSSWKALRIRDAWISQSKEGLNQHLLLIKT